MKNNISIESHQLINLTQKQQIHSSDVMVLRADVNYTVLNLTTGEKIIAASTLKYFEKIFPESQFLRINKSTMLNKAFVKSINQNQVTLQNEEIITVSRRRKRYVLNNIQESDCWILDKRQGTKE